MTTTPIAFRAYSSTGSPALAHLPAPVPLLRTQAQGVGNLLALDNPAPIPPICPSFLASNSLEPSPSPSRTDGQPMVGSVNYRSIAQRACQRRDREAVAQDPLLEDQNRQIDAGEP